MMTFGPGLASRLQIFDFSFIFHSGDPVRAQHQALRMVDNTINGQANLLSFADVFRYVAIAFVITLPLLFLLGQGRNRDAAAAAH
jgi:DHA2 family multidrug resistance protein